MNQNTFQLELPPKSLIREYEIIETLGQGGFGITYRARHTALLTYHAIKEFLPIDIATRIGKSNVQAKSEKHSEQFAHFRSSFLDEAKTLLVFQGHKNIVRVHDFFEENGTAYIVMDFVEGRNLSTYLKQQEGMLYDFEIREFLPQLLDALEAVHSKGIIHRDIKPDNIYMRDDMTPVLIDFGAARLHTQSASKPLSAILTEGYAPYEQYLQQKEGKASQKQGPWTDIYALSAVFYRCLTGITPPSALMRKHEVSEGDGKDPLEPITGIA
ncbi:MAG: serine/threonine-protein kinase, partial [Verrucomicrobia bacterium]|nr:serine/threonine-protein kinase [Verrucomicrobiota bacterium]